MYNVQCTYGTSLESCLVVVMRYFNFVLYMSVTKHSTFFRTLNVCIVFRGLPVNVLHFFLDIFGL